jgi:hypothetical protein
MTRTSRIVMMAAAFVFAAGSVASANTVELTLTVPISLTLPGNGVSPALEATGAATDRRLKPFDVNCVIGSGLGYATGSGAQGTIVGRGSTATSGSKSIYSPSGAKLANPTATVIITYDDSTISGAVGAATGGAGAGKVNVPGGYLCWVQWTTPLPTVPPIFVQGALQAK